MKALIILQFLFLSSLAFSQMPRPLEHEIERHNIRTTLMWSSTGIDDHPIWSPDSRTIAINEMGTWLSLNLDETIIKEAEWNTKFIGLNASEVSEILHDSLIGIYKNATQYEPRKITSPNGNVYELRMKGTRTAFYVNNKLKWTTSGENCHSLSLSPDGKYIAYIAELNGLMIYATDKKSIKRNVSKYIKASNSAINLAENNQFHKAETIWNKILNSNNNFKEAYYWKAVIRLSEGKKKESIESLNKVLEIDPDAWSIYFMLGSYYQNNDEPELAIKNYKEYIRIRPTDLYGYYYLAELYSSSGDIEKACENYKLAKKYRSKRAEKKIEELCSE